MNFSQPGGWVDGMKIDNKDHLSPADLAEASCNWSWAELGNNAQTLFRPIKKKYFFLIRSFLNELRRRYWLDDPRCKGQFTCYICDDVFLTKTSLDTQMNSHNGNSHTELTWEEKTSAVEFLKCTLYDEKLMNELDKMKHVERKHRETLYGKRKRQNLSLEDLNEVRRRHGLNDRRCKDQCTCYICDDFFKTRYHLISTWTIILKIPIHS